MTDEEDRPGEIESSSEQPTVCPNGHSNPPGQKFCGKCGSPITVPTGQGRVEPGLAPPSAPLKTPTMSRRRWLVLGGGAGAIVGVTLALVLLLGGKSHTITGNATLFGIAHDDIFLEEIDIFEDREARKGEPCSGTGGYDDIDSGLEVVVRNEAGTVLGTSNLRPGRVAEAEGDFVACELNFEINDVGEARFYSVEIGRRGEVRFTAAEMEQKDWHVELSLGA